MKKRFDQEEEVVWISIPVSCETAARLRNLSDVCHADPVAVAASLLHDVLEDDEAANEDAVAAVEVLSVLH